MPTLAAVALVVLAAVPATLVRFVGIDVPVELATLFDGLAIVGAAFAMAWGAEAAELDIPRALALTVVALLAVFPEYAVDIIFGFKAGQNPAFAPFAAANMTGSNRLLLGLGWPTIAVLTWLTTGARQLRLTRDAVLPLSFLAVATIYSFVLPFKARISLVDTVILLSLFLVYAVVAARQETTEPDLVGPAAAIGALPTPLRRLAIAGLFAFAGVCIALFAAPFADGLVRTGQNFRIDEFLLVQWLAPLASEAPEFLVAALLAARGMSSAALGLLLTSKLNQWTLLVGSLPVAYAAGVVSSAATSMSPGAIVTLALPLDSRQVAEIALTSCQSLFGVALLANLTLYLREAVLLAGLFLAQLILGGVLRTGLQSPDGGTDVLMVFCGMYLALSVVFGIRARKNLGVLWRTLLPSIGIAR
jgi:cation:H+ antiporter